MQIDDVNTNANRMTNPVSSHTLNTSIAISNILQIIPYIVKTISVHDKEGSILSSQIGQKTIADITASRLTDIFNRKGLLK